MKYHGHSASGQCLPYDAIDRTNFNARAVAQAQTGNDVKVTTGTPSVFYQTEIVIRVDNKKRVAQLTRFCCTVRVSDTKTRHARCSRVPIYEEVVIRLSIGRQVDDRVGGHILVARERLDFLTIREFIGCRGRHLPGKSPRMGIPGRTRRNRCRYPGQ